MKKIHIIIVALSVAFIMGCSSIKSYVESYADIARDQGISEEYLSTLQKWTREQTGYSQLETKFHIAATYKSEAFNGALLQEQVRVLSLGDEEKQKREATQSQWNKDFTEFFFYAYTDVRTANDFADRNSIWRVFLVDEKGQQTNPLEIRKVDKVTSMTESLFPYIKKYYGHCYNIKFPRQSGSPLKLVFSSALGKIELQWNP